jgi:hypothetical protein
MPMVSQGRKWEIDEMQLKPRPGCLLIMVDEMSQSVQVRRRRVSRGGQQEWRVLKMRCLSLACRSQLLIRGLLPNKVDEVPTNFLVEQDRRDFRLNTRTMLKFSRELGSIYYILLFSMTIGIQMIKTNEYE